jgi:hypothetical protein
MTLWQLSPYKSKPKAGSIGHYAFEAQSPMLAVADFFRLYGEGNEAFVWVAHPATKTSSFEPKSDWRRYCIMVGPEEVVIMPCAAQRRKKVQR